MNTAYAFFTMLIIWGTTPFFIARASNNSDALFAAMMRMAIATIICLFILKISKKSLNILKFYKKYLYAGSGIFITLRFIYISAKYIPSGIIAITFALTPIITGIFAHIMNIDRFNIHQILSSIIGLIGMIIIFFNDNFGNLYYLLLLIIAMIFQAFVSVKLKSIKLNISTLQTTTGGLLFSLPFFIINFLIFEYNIPAINNDFIIATLYLAIFGSIFGFLSYYYLIDNARIFLVSIIPMITPIIALLLGVYFNNEIITFYQYIGSTIILLSLVYYELSRRKS